VASLKGTDRAKQKALEIAGNGSWKMVVAELARTDSEQGCQSYDGGFEVANIDESEACLSEICNTDGSSGGSHRKWMRELVNFIWLEDNGMILGAAKDELESVWGEGVSGNIELTGNAGATRETTYNTYILTAFSKDSLFERIADAAFSTVVEQVIENPLHLMQRILRFMKNKKENLSSCYCLKLLSITDFDVLSTEATRDRLETIVGCLSSSEVPTPQLANALVSLVEHYGWTAVTEPIRTLLRTRLRFCKTLLVCKFLERADFILRVVRTYDQLGSILLEHGRPLKLKRLRQPPTGGFTAATAMLRV